MAPCIARIISRKRVLSVMPVTHEIKINGIMVLLIVRHNFSFYNPKISCVLQCNFLLFAFIG